MICSVCGTSNPAEARFCLECGSSLAARCGTCGATNPAGAKFCGTCGTRLAGQGSGTEAAAQRSGGFRDGAAADGPGAQAADAGNAAGGASATAGAGGRDDATGVANGPTERRMVSVLFADLVGFTTLSSTRDPETIRDLQDRYFERAREIIGRYGGVIEKFIGDAVMAVWGAPTAHEDDAERAVRAALDLVDAVPVVGRAAGLDLQIRAGVLTGEAAVSIGALDQGMVTGDMVNTAARLQSVAPPGGVLVGESTRLATESAIAYEPVGPQALKGKEAPVQAWRALRILGERGGARRPDALEPPFVGRADELRFLKEQFHATGRERRTRLISLVGQAGIGKTRLAWELEKYLDGVVEQVWWHRGRAPSYGEGVTFWALGEMIRRRAGLAEGDDEETTRAAIASMVATHVPEEADRAWIEPRLLTLLGIGDPVTGGHEELFAAWRTFFERLAATGTVALVIEDLQWSDDGLLDFLEHVIDWARNSPIFVLTLARPELLDRRPGWGNDRRGAISMRLDPLADDAIRELLAGIAPGLPSTAVARIVARADGIPLYAVETVRMLVSSGRLVPDGDRLALAPGADLVELDVPPTLHALVAARLDALRPADRSLLQDAAVLGQSFTTAALAAMTGETPEALAPRLQALVLREILTIETDPRAPTRGQHAFVQALVREVAYGTLSRKERRSRHLTAARYFETLSDEELAGAVASHFVAAYRAAPDGPEGEAVATQARIALVATADRAETLGALGQAVEALREAIGVSRDPAEKARLLERLGFVETSIARIDDAVPHLREAIATFEALGDRPAVVHATANLVLTLLAPGRVTDAMPIAAAVETEAAAMASSPTGRSEAEAAAIFAEANGRLHFRAHDFATALEWSDRALALAEKLALDAVIGHAMVTKATCFAFLERTREAVALMQGAIADARAHGQHSAALRGANNLTSFLALTDPRAAFQLCLDSIALTRRLGFRAFDGYLSNNLAFIGLRTGDWDVIARTIGETMEGYATDDEALLWLQFSRDFSNPWTGRGDTTSAEHEVAASIESGDFQGRLNGLTRLSIFAFVEGRLDDSLRDAADMFAGSGGLTANLTFEARFALHARRPEIARAALAAFHSRPGGVSDFDIAMVEAGLAAIEGRTADAIAGYRSVLAGYRQYGVRFDVALTVFDMVVLLGPEEAAVRSVISEGRQILVDLGADALLERFDAAVEHRVDPGAATLPGAAGGRTSPTEATVAEH